MADADGLRVYDKDTGEVLGIDTNLGLPGMRGQGYIPHNGDILYLPQTEKLVAVKLGSER